MHHPRFPANENCALPVTIYYFPHQYIHDKSTLLPCCDATVTKPKKKVLKMAAYISLVSWWDLSVDDEKKHFFFFFY